MNDKPRELEALIWQLRRHYPDMDTVATYGQCRKEGCEESARGSGLCPLCCMYALGDLTDRPHDAWLLLKNTQENAEATRRMYEALK